MDLHDNLKMVRWHIFFSGRVQHVGFRWISARFARELYLTGWVRNEPDGRVEMEVQGSVSSIRQLIIRLKAQPHIIVEDLEVEEVPVVPSERVFSVKGY